MPRHDFARPKPRKDAGGKSFTPGFAYLAWVDARRPGKKRDRDKDGGGVPADPLKPDGRSGGSAVELDFRED